MTTVLKLKCLRETPQARLYQDHRGTQQWVPRSVCPRTTKLGDQHEVTIEDWWLKENPFRKPDGKQAALL